MAQAKITERQRIPIATPGMREVAGVLAVQTVWDSMSGGRTFEAIKHLRFLHMSYMAGLINRSQRQVGVA